MERITAVLSELTEIIHNIVSRIILPQYTEGANRSPPYRVNAKLFVDITKKKTLTFLEVILL